MDSEKLRVAREKITRVFRYLEALNQHRNPPKREIRDQLWHLWLHDLPNHPSIRQGAAKSNPGSAKSKSADTQSAETASNASFVLRVQRPQLTRPPEPPREIAEWLESGWDDPSNHSLVLESREESPENGESKQTEFAADPGRLAALRRWTFLRDEWAKTEKPACAAMRAW